MEKTAWTYQQYDPVSREAYPVPADDGEVTVYGVPDGYEAPILKMFEERDARRKRCRIISFQ